MTEFATKIRDILREAGISIPVTISPMGLWPTHVKCPTCVIQSADPPIYAMVFSSGVGLCTTGGGRGGPAIPMLEALSHAGYPISDSHDPDDEVNDETRRYTVGRPVDVKAFEREHAQRLSDRAVELGITRGRVHVLDNGGLTIISHTPFPDALMLEFDEALMRCQPSHCRPEGQPRDPDDSGIYVMNIPHKSTLK